jgi:hypothetical protein
MDTEGVTNPTSRHSELGSTLLHGSTRHSVQVKAWMKSRFESGAGIQDVIVKSRVLL